MVHHDDVVLAFFFPKRRNRGDRQGPSLAQAARPRPDPAITGSAQSTLAKAGRCSLIILGPLDEVCPLGPGPQHQHYRDDRGRRCAGVRPDANARFYLRRLRTLLIRPGAWDASCSRSRRSCAMAATCESPQPAHGARSLRPGETPRPTHRGAVMLTDDDRQACGPVHRQRSGPPDRGAPRCRPSIARSARS